MLYAKSIPEESIKEHTNQLLDRLKVLRVLYGDEITKNISIDTERFWKLLEVICTYHDIGKCYTPFQNEILRKLGKQVIDTNFNYIDVKHEQLSPMFIDSKYFGLTKEERKLVIQSIFYHHERNNDMIIRELIEKIIQEDIVPKLENFESELGINLNKTPNSMYLGCIGYSKRVKEQDEYYKEYCLLKGLLHRLDYSSSAHVKVEDETQEKISDYTKRFMKQKNYDKNELQLFCEENSDKNIVVIGSTGMGKTEAALLWSNSSKTFFTLPIRISINAIYDRICELLGYEHVGLLHSTALDYLQENVKDESEIKQTFKDYEETINLSSKITTCTIDQIFKFVFKYRGYEREYATLSYSKIVIDEIQGYSPEIVAILLKGIEMIYKIGGKFMIMTATLPGIYKQELEKMGVKFKYNQFLKETKRHKIKIRNSEIISDIEMIKQKGMTNKVLIIVNTINKAIELYKKIQDENVKMLHSRFILKDRNLLESEIKDFSKSTKKGIWITTQIVEASLDIDFDYLFTEMSTLDSLFQRFGRCYRSREYNDEECNVYVYTKEVSGIDSVYDKDISRLSEEILQVYDGQILDEKEKVDMVEKLYSKENLKGTKFLKKFEDGMNVLNNIVDYEVSKSEAQSLLRNIDNIKVIPKVVYDDNLNLFDEYKQAKNNMEKYKLRRKIEVLTTSIRVSQARKLKDRINSVKYVEDIFCIDMKYDEKMGLVLEKDEEYELNSRFC